MTGLSRSGEPDFATVRTLADRFKVSLRATAIALIRAGLAEPSLYVVVEEAAPVSDYEKPGGGPGGRRDTGTIHVYAERE